MTEIKIEKKTILWPWILGGICIVAFFLVYFFYFREKDPKIVSTKQDDGQVHQSIVAYTNYADSDTTTMELNHEYSNTALLKLAEATQNLADLNGYEVNDDIKKVKQFADQITYDPSVDTHANKIRQAAVLLSNVLFKIHNDRFPDLLDEASQLRASAEQIDTDELTLDQKNKVKAFFNNASVLLKKMDNK